MTLSILAYDAVTDVVGGAVTTCALAGGRRILHLRAGVGIVATQASSEIVWGELLLDALEQGESVARVVESVAFDESQVAAVVFGGDLAAHTGAACTPHAGTCGDVGVTCQVNTAALPDASARMLAAFRSSEGPLAERLVAAIAASGGDARGAQSAAVFVTGRTPLAGYADEPHVDLRVDDHRAPVEELARLLSLHRAHCEMRLGEAEPGPAHVERLQALLSAHPDDPHLRRALDRARSA